LRPLDKRLRMVVGVTSAQTCLVLAGRLAALRKAGFAVTLVASPGARLTERAEAEGVAVAALAMHREIAPLMDLWSLARLMLLLARLRPVLTDFSTPKAGLLGNVAAWLLGVPHRVYTLRGLKLESSRGWKREVLLWSERLAARLAHVVLCNSESLRAEALRLGIAPERKLRLLGDGSSNGVDIYRFSPKRGPRTVRRSLGIRENDLVVGYVGRLTGDKGIPELLLAYEEVIKIRPECWLLLVGWFDAAEDALGADWRRRIAVHPRICCTGYVADVPEYCRAMDMLVLPTHREGFPNVALEAAACGLPVITTESTGARDAVVAEVTGLLVPAGYPEALTEAMLRLLGDAGLRAEMGAAGRRWVVERFSQARVLGLAVEFYRGLVEGRRPGKRDQGSGVRE
jgi:glycosyltransferase involved in cell wall biosynthesis